MALSDGLVTRLLRFSTLHANAGHPPAVRDVQDAVTVFKPLLQHYLNTTLTPAARQAIEARMHALLQQFPGILDAQPTLIRLITGYTWETIARFDESKQLAKKILEHEYAFEQKHGPQFIKTIQQIADPLFLIRHLLPNAS